MRNRGIIVIFALLSILPAALPGQEAPESPNREQAIERLQKIKDRLQLTPEQTEQVRPVLMEEVQKLKAVRDKSSGDQSRRSRLKMARELRGIQDSTDNKLRAILSKKQMDEMKKIREESRQQFKERMNR